MSKDLKELIPGVKGFASSNLRYMAKFYSLYTPLIFPQVVGNLSEEDLFAVPWRHHRIIIDRCKEDSNKAVFFVEKTIQNNWSRAVLENFLDTDLYDRQGKAISNFAYALPAAQSNLAQEMTKDPYNFDFNQEEYEKMSHAANPYGDGHACERIADVLEYGEVKAIKIRMGCRI